MGVGVGEPTRVAVGNGVGVMVGVLVGIGVEVGKTNGNNDGALSTAAPGNHSPLASKYQVPSVYQPMIVNGSPAVT